MKVKIVSGRVQLRRMRIYIDLYKGDNRGDIDEQIREKLHGIVLLQSRNQNKERRNQTYCKGGGYKSRVMIA